MAAKPRVWSTFTVNTKNGEKKLRIQDMTSDRLDDVAYMFAKYFAPDEVFFRAAGLAKSEEAQEECKQLCKELLKKSEVQICCVDEGTESDVVTGELISAGIMILVKADDPEEKVNLETSTKEMGRWWELKTTFFSRFNVMKHLGLDILYDDRGLVVHPDYRGLGIAQKMFNARRVICKEKGVPTTGAWMTAFGSQKAAERDGWETIFEETYENISKLLDTVFELSPPTCKYMLAKAE